MRRAAPLKKAANASSVTVVPMRGWSPRVMASPRGTQLGRQPARARERRPYPFRDSAEAEDSSDLPFRRIYPFGISRKRLEQAIRETGARAAIADELGDADTVMTLRTYFRRKPQALRDAEGRGLPIYVLKTNTVMQMEQSLLSMASQANGEGPDVDDAMQETEDAITGVLNGHNSAVELTPQNAYIRKLQHQMAQRYNLTSKSEGREPFRRVLIGRDDRTWF